MRRWTATVCGVVLCAWSASASADNGTVRVRAPWSYVDGCHVLLAHGPYAFGTRLSLTGVFTAQSALRERDHAGTAPLSGAHLLTFDQPLWPDASVVAYVEGGRGDGLDPLLGDVLGTDAVAGEPDTVYLSRLWFQQDLFDKRLQFLAGKIDLSDFFDTNAVINCEYVEFLSPSLVNNPTIPFPPQGLGAAVRVAPRPWFYAQAALGDAHARETGTGFDTAFHGGGRGFTLIETGVSPIFAGREGNYRFIGWHNGGGFAQDRDTGFALSFDQQLTDRVTVAARYGHAPKGGAIRDFWSLGAKLSPTFAARKHDVLGFAVAQAIPFKGGRAPGERIGDETLFETYYAIYASKHLRISPHLQVIVNPGASTDHMTDVVAGLRITVAF